MIRSDPYYTCEQIVKKQNETTKKRDERRKEKERKKINKTTQKMYKKGKEQKRLPFRLSWSYYAQEYAESLGFKICEAKFGFKLKNKALCYIDAIR